MVEASAENWTKLIQPIEENDIRFSPKDVTEPKGPSVEDPSVFLS